MFVVFLDVYQCQVCHVVAKGVMLSQRSGCILYCGRMQRMDVGGGIHVSGVYIEKVGYMKHSKQLKRRQRGVFV